MNINRIGDRLKGNGKLNVEEAKSKDPLVRINGLMAYNTEADVIMSLKTQNKHLWADLQQQDFRVVERYRRKLRNQLCCNLVLQVSPQVHARLVGTEKVHIDLQRLEVVDHSPTRQFTKCLGFGHGRRHCSERTDLCSHCGGPHLRSQCKEFTGGTAPKCRNCCLEKKRETDHSAFSEDCPVWIRWDRITRAGTDYLC